MIKNNNNFDILRLLLAFFVFLAHWNGLTNQNIINPLFNMGHLSVDMFFIISGFLIYWSFDKNNNKVSFYIKRFFRIFPLYAIVIFLQTFFFIIYADGNIWQLLKYFVSNILFLNFISPSVSDVFSHFRVDAINGSLWTLKNEIIFYFFVPYIHVAYKRYRIKFLILIYLLSFIYISFVGMLKYDFLINQFPAQLRLFIVGVFLYVIFSKLTVKILTLLFFSSISLIYALYQNSVFYYLIYPFCIGFILMYLAYAIKIIKLNFDFSYSLYIIHFPIIQLSLLFGFEMNNIYDFFILVFTVLIFSWLSERYIEKRFITIGRNLVANKTFEV